MRKPILFFLLLMGIYNPGRTQVVYPYPVHLFSLSIENKNVRMAYMDIKPATANGETIILFHGKNFSGYYWKDLIPALSEKGYRVIVPDQVGWGRSEKPVLHYSFHIQQRPHPQCFINTILPLTPKDPWQG
ncbi:MAG: alpha/beta fold hydrolase [Chitinophagaceae bacterium]